MNKEINPQKMPTQWKIDTFIKELQEYGVELTLNVKRKAPNHISFDIMVRDRKVDIEKLTKLLFSFFGH